MDSWKVLNAIRKAVYCGKENQYGEELNLLISTASISEDPDFVKSVLQLKEDIESPSTKQKLLWLTSTVRHNFYPPLPVDLAGPICWNENQILQNGSAKLASKYCSFSALQSSGNLTQKLSQCADIDDCSFVASLINAKIHEVNLPRVKQVSINLYHVNLYFNGAANRLVTVDTSSIPTDLEGNQLSITSSEITDKVVELAYLLVTTGSYNASGSNCAIDTFRLTGFVPEVVNVKKYNMKRLLKYFHSGLCLLGVGTGDDSTKLVAPIIKNHDYPIVGVNEVSESLVVRDPLDSDNFFEVNSEDLVRHYEQIYLNWCTSKLFSQRDTINFLYNAKICNHFISILDKPIFTLTNGARQTEPVWLLLESHLKNEAIDLNSISYLQEIPRNILANVSARSDSACDIGLQLLQLQILPESKIRFFCHSSTNASFTIHTFSNSTLVTLGRDKRGIGVSFVEYTTNFYVEATLGSCEYYKHPTFSLEINSSVTQEVALNLQLLSEKPQDMLNMQVFHLNDNSFTKPIVRDGRYEQQKYDKFYVPLTTNTQYKIVCSTYSKPESQSFKLLAAASYPKEASHFNIKLKEIFLEYGGYTYQTNRRFCWPDNTNKIKIPITSMHNNVCFVRIVPETRSSFLFIRCNIFDNDDHKKIHADERYQRVGPGGLVIDQIEIYDSCNLVLLIEKDEPRTPEKTLPAVSFRVLIGSRKRITFDD